MKILAVGAAGYLGGKVADVIKASSRNEVTVYDNLLYEKSYLKDCDFIFGDVRDTKKLCSIEKKYDKIVWLAAIVGDGACAVDPTLTREINLESLVTFLGRTHRKILFCSTCSVFGAQSTLLSEASPTNPLSLYASLKLEAEDYVLKNKGCVFRLGTLYGLGDGYARTRFDLVVNVLTLKAIREGKLTVFGGEQWRPVISVTDVASYIFESLQKDLSGLYIISRENVKIIDLAKRIKKVFKEVEIEVTEMKFEDLRNYKVKTTKAESSFAFKPTLTIEEEVGKLARVIGEGRIKDVTDPLYVNVSYLKEVLK